MNSSGIMHKIGRVMGRIGRKPRIGLVLSGGGCKAFFGLGVGEALLEAGVPIKAIAGTSAGSAMAFSLISRSTEAVVRYFYAITLRNPANFHWKRLLLGKRPFPHERMYRRALASYIDFDRFMKSDIEVAVNTLRLPPEIYPTDDHIKRARLLARLIQVFRNDNRNEEKGIFTQLMPKFAEDAGLQEVVFRRKDFDSRQKIVDVVLASSSTPPMVSFQRLNDGHYYLDGGIIDNLPVKHLQDCDLIIAVYYEDWSRRQLELSGADAGHTLVYVRPDKEMPITTWDYASPNGVREAYQMGIKAGEKTLNLLQNIL